MRIVKTTAAALALFLAAPAGHGLAQSQPDALHGGHAETAVAEPDTAHAAAAKGYMEAMETMERAMAAVEMAGDPDVDFARMMIPHHQSAIDMAEVMLLHGKDEQIKALAQKIITDQKGELEQLQAWLDANATN